MRRGCVIEGLFFFLKRLGRFKHDYMLLKKRKRERFVE